MEGGQPLRGNRIGEVLLFGLPRLKYRANVISRIDHDCIVVAFCFLGFEEEDLIATIGVRSSPQRSLMTMFHWGLSITAEGFQRMVDKARTLQNPALPL